MATPKARKNSRNWMMAIAALALVLLIAWSFWPRAILVDLGKVERADMIVTIDEEARTRVRDAYVVSAPIAGRLLRVDVEPGDAVVGGETVIARMTPTPPSALDVRTREQARASVSAAEAALRVAQADLNSALAGQDLADAEVLRMRTLRKTDVVAQAALDRAERQKRVADAVVDTAKAAISMRNADLANARARLIGFESQSLSSQSSSGPGTVNSNAIPLTAPISGRILRVIQESETTVAPGQAILEIGDVSNDLEVLTELLSTDAVQVSTGDRVVIDNWGGDVPLNGVIERVEPWGFTKFSALGVEEQRVNTIIRFTDELEDRASLGHGYRVNARIVIWEVEDGLVIPSSALFRSDGGWATFVVDGGRARLTPVEVDQNNGVSAHVVDGVSGSETVILYPGPGLSDGNTVKQRQIGE